MSLSEVEDDPACSEKQGLLYNDKLKALKTKQQARLKIRSEN